MSKTKDTRLEELNELFAEYNQEILQGKIPQLRLKFTNMKKSDVKINMEKEVIYIRRDLCDEKLAEELFQIMLELKMNL